MEFAVRHFMAGRLRLFVPALRRLSEDSDQTVAEAAKWALGRLGHNSFHPVEDYP